MCVLLFLTSIFEKLAMNTMAAIIIVGVSSLFDLRTARELWRVRSPA